MSMACLMRLLLLSRFCLTLESVCLSGFLPFTHCIGVFLPTPNYHNKYRRTVACWPICMDHIR